MPAKSSSFNLYTVTFALEGIFDLPNNRSERMEKTSDLVVSEMKAGNFELVDFNLTANYHNENAKRFTKDKKIKRSILEITLKLDANDLESREAIAEKCLSVLIDGYLKLTRADESDFPDQGVLQSIICFTEK